MTLTGSKEVPRLYRVINNRELHIKTVFLCEYTLVARIESRVCHDNRRPARPNVDRKFHDQLSVLHVLDVITDATHSRNSRPLNQARGVRPDEQRNIRWGGFGRLEILFDLSHVNRLALRPALRCN